MVFDGRLVGALLMWLAIIIDHYIEIRREGPPGKCHPKAFRPSIHPVIYLSYLCVLIIMNILSFGIREGVSLFLWQCLPVWIQISLYYCLLLPLLAVLRKQISPKACAKLWLLPNVLYILNCSGPLGYPNAPWLVLSVSKALERILLPLWLAGFVTSFSWQMADHFRIRKRLLSQSNLVLDSETLSIWEESQASIELDFPLRRLYRCRAVQTPVSIGLAKKSICVLLPEKTYTAEELALIFRHELIHIKRKDCQCKLTLVFFTSLFWFNPLGILAKRRCSEDLELSCDESVLLGAAQDTREKYARLLLRTAGEDRGFSSCLSASAKSLFYRLSNVLHPKKRSPGAVAAGFLCALLILSCGYITVSYAHCSGSDVLFSKGDPSQFCLESITLEDSDREYMCSDEEALVQYLNQLRIHRLSGEYYHEESYWYKIMFTLPNGKIQISLSGHRISVFGFHNGKAVADTWYHDGQIDRAFLMGLLTDT